MAKGLTSRIARSLLQVRRRNFLRDERGVTAIEFGLLSLPFFSILGAILETSVVFLSGQILDSAIQDTARLIRTGQVQQTGTTPSQFKQRVCDNLFGLFTNCDLLHVEVRVVSNFTTLDVSPPVDWNCNVALPACNDWTRPEQFTPGQPNEIVLVQVYYKWPIIIPFGGLGLNNLPNGNRLMGGAAVFRNEPYI